MSAHRQAVRFSLKGLLTSVALIAIGLGMVVTAVSDDLQLSLPAGGVLWITAGAFIGAGIFKPLGRPWLGVVFGVAAHGIFFLIMCVFAGY
jgi:hypothetical protein